MEAASPDFEAERSHHTKMRRLIGFAIGVILLSVAVWVVATNQEAMRQAFESASNASWVLIVAALVLPFAHWHFTSLVFWLLMRRFGVVRLGEMHLLIGAAGLLNYLPMRPGMFGRIAYHKRVNKIRIQDSVRVTIECTILTAIANGVVIAAALLAAFMTDTWTVWLVVGAPSIGFVLVGLVAGINGQNFFAARSAWALALAARYLDTLAWVGRYAIGFMIIGHPITVTQAAVFAAASQLAMMVPFVGSGLGVREWGIGIAFPMFQRDAARAVGLTGDLLNRSAEVLIAVPVGLICMGLLARSRASTDLPAEH